MNLDCVYVEFLASFDDSLCTYDNSAAKNCYSIHYMYSLHWVLTILSCNQCVLLYILRICCCWRICWIVSPLHCFESFPVVVGLMNPCSWFPNNYGLLFVRLGMVWCLDQGSDQDSYCSIVFDVFLKTKYKILFFFFFLFLS